MKQQKRLGEGSRFDSGSLGLDLLKGAYQEARA
jgi:hypothetical protein